MQINANAIFVQLSGWIFHFASRSLGSGRRLKKIIFSVSFQRSYQAYVTKTTY